MSRQGFHLPSATSDVGSRCNQRDQLCDPLEKKCAGGFTLGSASSLALTSASKLSYCSGVRAAI
eukprot:7377885-Prymnesium_polylepis.2